MEQCINDYFFMNIIGNVLAHSLLPYTSFQAAVTHRALPGRDTLRARRGGPPWRSSDRAPSQPPRRPAPWAVAPSDDQDPSRQTT